MKVVSVISETYQEFENHLSVVLFCFGCNYKCDFCYNHELVTDPLNIIQKDVYSIIEEQLTPLTDGIVLLGGEPTIYPVEELCRWVKQKGLDVKLYTNGTNKEIVKQGLEEGWLDQVSIDFKCYQDCEFIRGAGIKYGLDMTRFLIELIPWKDQIEIRTTLAEHLTKADLERIKKICDKLQFKHILQREVNYKQYMEK